MPINYAARFGKYFTQAKVADIISNMPKPETPMKDLFFPAGRQKQKSGAFITVEDIQRVTGSIPLVRRGSRSYSLDDGSSVRKMIEVDGFIPSKFISATDLNTLISLGDEQAISAWVNENLEYLRDRISESTETLICQALSGKIAYPLASDGSITGKEEIDLGDPHAINSATVKKGDVGQLRKWLEDRLTEHRKKAGAASSPVNFVGATVYNEIVDTMTSKDNLPIVWTDTGMKLFGKYDVRPLDTSYTLPGSQQAKTILGADESRIIDIANPGDLFYLAIDDMDAKLAAMPFYAKPINCEDPSGIKLIGYSKPLPAFAMKRQSKQTVAFN